MTRIVAISAYSHPDPAIRLEHIREATSYETMMRAAGHDCFALIAEAGRMMVMSDPDGYVRGKAFPPDDSYGAWTQINDPLIAAADAIRVLKGRTGCWSTSRGMAHEIKLAERLHKPIQWLELRSCGWVTLGGTQDVQEALARHRAAQEAARARKVPPSAAEAWPGVDSGVD